MANGNNDQNSFLILNTIAKNNSIHTYIHTYILTQYETRCFANVPIILFHWPP
jgi:hypothetical protein